MIKRETSAMRLRLVYRSYGGENAKGRPYFYSKALALTSFVRAAAKVPTAEVIFLNDGPIPQDRLDIMQRHGSVHQIADQPVGMRNSYRYGLRLPKLLGWDESDVVSYVEDDYLFTADAFTALDEAMRQLPEASYFTLHGVRPADAEDRAGRRFLHTPQNWQAQPDHVVDGRVWANVASTTSTFCARVGVLHQDREIFWQCMVPFRRRFLDHETCLLYQGYMPYRGKDVLTGLYKEFEPSARGIARTLVLAPFRVALNARALLQRTPHYLYGVFPNLTTHLELGVHGDQQDWPAVAAGVAQWAEDQQLPHVAASIRVALAMGGPETVAPC
jgi:hypothetical protein